MDPWTILGVLLLVFATFCVGLAIIIAGALLRYVTRLLLRSYRQR